MLCNNDEKQNLHLPDPPFCMWLLLRILSSSQDWVFTLFASVVIGQSFDFKTINWKSSNVGWLTMKGNSSLSHKFLGHFTPCRRLPFSPFNVEKKNRRFTHKRPNFVVFSTLKMGEGGRRRHCVPRLLAEAECLMYIVSNTFMLSCQTIIMQINFCFEKKLWFILKSFPCSSKKAACFALGGYLRSKNNWIVLKCEIECCNGNNCKTNVTTLSENAISVFTPGGNTPLFFSALLFSVVNKW